MIRSPNLGLYIWNSLTDPYDSTQLAESLARVDEHDHTPGKGLPIGTSALADASVTASKLAPGAIPKFPDIKDIGTSQILDGAITAAKLAPGAINIDKQQTAIGASMTGTSSISNSTNKMSYTTEDYDTGNMVNLGVSTSQMSITKTGLYLIISTNNWSNPGDRSAYYAASSIIKNNMTTLSQSYGSGSLTSSNQNILITRLTVGDYIELQYTFNGNQGLYTSSLNSNLSAALIGL